MPTIERATIVEEDMRQSTGSSFPTPMAVNDNEGWLHYKADEDRWYTWNGVDWVMFAVSDVPNSELADMAQATIKGRQSGAGTGSPEDLTPAQARTVLNVADGANNYSHPNHTGDVTSVGDGATTIANGAVTDAKLRDSAGLSVIGRGNLGSGTPGDITTWLSSDHVLRESAGTVGWGKIVNNNVTANTLTNSKLANMAQSTIKGRQAGGGTGDPEDLTSTQAMAVLADRLYGTSFPGSPVDGQVFTRTDHNTVYYYSSSRSGWLSVQRYLVWFQWAADVSVTAYLGWSPTTTQFTNTFGPFFAFQTKITELSLVFATSGTGTAQVFDDGTGITGASLALSSETTKVDSTLNSSAVAAYSILGVKRTAGTLEGPGLGYFVAQRFET